MKLYNYLAMISLLVTIAGCSNENYYKVPVGARIIRFSGYDWIVSTTGDTKGGPGPNYFSDSEENVWIDEEGRLHLRITYRDGRWNCARVEMAKSYGYDKYVFYVSSRPDSLDRQVVWGLYTYKNDEEEIDIEFSRWGFDNNQEAQYAIQPSSVPGNKARFRMNLEGSYSTHIIDWGKKWIDFASYHGHLLNPVNTTQIIASWRYSGNNIPPDSDEKLKINLWLFRGTPPSDGKEAEVVVNRFEIL
jgi:hypothetical protein